MTGLYRLMLAAAAAFGAASPAGAEGPGGAEVTAVSLTPVAGRTEVVIAVRGAADVKDFLLADPARLVLDVVGARLNQTAPAQYDGVKRGGVLNLRYSQFRPDVVRIVLDLDTAKPYQVDRAEGAIRITFGTDQAFKAWSSADEGVAPVVVADTPEETPAAAAPSRAPEVMLASGREPVLHRAGEPRLTVTWDRASVADVVAGFARSEERRVGKECRL